MDDLQEMMPLVVDGAVVPGMPQELCFGQMLSMAKLQHLSITRGAANIFGESLAFLSDLTVLSAVHFSDDHSGEGGWSADNPEAWSMALQPLSGLQASSYLAYKKETCKYKPQC